MENTSQFQISVVSPNDEGCRFYLEQYKPFRLKALQQDPDAFGSTHARELAFDDEAWLARLKTPAARIYVAVRSSDGSVVASTALIGPLVDAHPASNPYQTVADGGRADGEDLTKPMCFQMAAVYTVPEARGCGLAKALITAASDEAAKLAAAAKRSLALSVVVYATNNAAISVYERCGFVKGADGPKLIYNELKDLSEEYLHMFLSPTP
ncbi:hypothetical protein F5Y16DRAFT_404866 [Xylariaceae sp. FL0255]|nr:hypothetical protein F5Y16DRAFT_404866 [Xylariaceae sp. FL0255]